MTPSGTQILQMLATVSAERAVRAADPDLAVRVTDLKRYQQARFEKTYADLLDDVRYGGAARFFLDDLYGPTDFSERDAQFARIVPALVRLFPPEIVSTVESLSALHALSEQFDTAMARSITGRPLTASAYVDAWRRTGDPVGRDRQIALMLDVGHALDMYTRRPLLRHSLRAMRIPARAAGLAALQTFLESGFETFRALNGADWFLVQIARRERTLAASLFGDPGSSDPLGQLP